MRDVAKLAGVGTMTVSRVLNSSAPVTEETRNRVHQAVRQLNYTPDPVARSLRQARSRSIGIIVPNFYDPFFATCAHAIGLVAKKHQYSVSVTTSDEDAGAEFTEANLMVLNHVDGLAVIPAALGKSRFDRPEFHSTHIVTLDRPIHGHRFNSVLVENREGANVAVKHLIWHGHTRICYLGLSEKLYTLNERYEGYKKAMQQAGLSPDQHLTCSTEEETCALIEQALSDRRPPTAVFIGNNLVMRNALHAFSKLNITIPKDVAVVGFDDFEMADIFNPSITVVRQPTLELGRVAAELLFSRLENKNVSLVGQQIVLACEFVVRQSCGCNPHKPLFAR
ncbi:LacI family DNA-binding transcriptional regulator [Tunturiibacter lichenicola]|uniref:LacI family DNA-binding transcriptional regulator n=1 Tax=Tunturiibacter lichenicola TaxID=2051959 RepID=UPI003D9BA96C